MKTVAFTLAALLAALAASPDVRAADDPQLQRLALCQDRWIDWKDDGARLSQLGNYFETRFDRSSADGAFAPRSPTSVFGWSVTEVYPQSVGMGVGFSLTVNADHARARAVIERQIGKPMKCSNSEGVRSCAVELGAQKTVVLMTGQDGKEQSSLVGCFYLYQQ